MQSLALLIFVGFMAFTWVRGTRRRRQRWLERLSLPGTWDQQNDDESPLVLQLSGKLEEGTYRLTGTPGGRWRLQGNTLLLESRDGEQRRLDLTFYDVGKIGLEKAPGQRAYFQKRAANVVPLHKRA